MADEFYTGLCSTMSWWNTMRNPASFDFPLPLTPPPISCTTESISWSAQPFLPAEEQLNQMQTGFGDSSMSDHDQALLPGMFEPTVDMIGDLQPASWPKFSSSSSASTADHHQLSRVSSPSKQQLRFCNINAPFWNPSEKIPEPRFEDESTGCNLIAMKSSETKRHGSDRDRQPPAKKARIATPSPLPTFKVRKEKLGDRITALQQLVSPFGKTDTASVLHEAIEYIKFLHGQVDALSTPYLKNGHQMQHQKSVESSIDEAVQDLRSRGLCLVPISSTFAVASETPMEFWAPTFLESYR